MYRKSNGEAALTLSCSEHEYDDDYDSTDVQILEAARRASTPMVLQHGKFVCHL